MAIIPALSVKYNWNTYIPAFQYCTDNAGMIAITAFYKFLEGQTDPITISSSARAAWSSE